jgi:hypothetical protein
MLRKPDNDLLPKSDWPHGDFTSTAFKQAVAVEAASGQLPKRWWAYASPPVTKKRSFPADDSNASSAVDMPQESEPEDNLPQKNTPAPKAMADDVEVGEGGGKGRKRRKGDTPGTGLPQASTPHTHLQDPEVRPDEAGPHNQF